MSFTATNTIPAADPVELVIANDGWFPNIDPADMREVMRLDGTVTPSRLRAAIVEAIATVNVELVDYKERQVAIGTADLAGVTGSAIVGVKVQVHRYKRAIYCLAKSNLIERYRDYDSNGEGNKRADEIETNIDDLHRDARWAISDILGTCRSTIELI